jgi:hypothetical protein
MKNRGDDKDDLKLAIMRLHNCDASYMKEVPIIEKFGSKTVWQGIVRVFKIAGNPQTDTCYAWSYPIEGSTKRRYYTVLKIPPIDSPEKAVRAAIIDDLKNKRRSK